MDIRYKQGFNFSSKTANNQILLNCFYGQKNRYITVVPQLVHDKCYRILLDGSIIKHRLIYSKSGSPLTILKKGLL